MLDGKFLRRMARSIKCFDLLCFGVKEEAECVPCNVAMGIDTMGGDGKSTHPPIPQQLGSVTLRAADVATAASAVEWGFGLGVRSACGRVDRRTGITALPEDFETGFGREWLGR